MNSKKKISISFREKNQENNNFEADQAVKEQAAGEEQQKNLIPFEVETSTNSTVNKTSQKKKKTKILKSPMKHVILTTMTALLISFGLGFLLLRMFVTLTDVSNVGSDKTLPSQTDQTSASVSDDAGLSTLSSYVVQAGVFSTEEKGEEWKMKLTALSVSSVIWERDGQFYLFVGSAPSQTAANKIAGELSGRNIDTYVKPWTLDIDEGMFSAAESEAVQEIVQSLNQNTLNDISDQKRMEWMKKLEEDSPLAASIKNWSISDPRNMNWVRTAHSLEK